MIEFEKYMKNEHCGIGNAVLSKEIERIFHMIERTLRHLNSRAEKIQKAREGMQKMLECMEHENTEPYKTGSV